MLLLSTHRIYRHLKRINVVNKVKSIDGEKVVLWVACFALI